MGSKIDATSTKQIEKNDSKVRLGRIWGVEATDAAWGRMDFGPLGLFTHFSYMIMFIVRIIT